VQCVLQALGCLPPTEGTNSSSHQDVEWRLDPESCLMSRSLQLLFPGGAVVTDRFAQAAMVTAEDEWEGDLGDLGAVLGVTGEGPGWRWTEQLGPPTGSTEVAHVQTNVTSAAEPQRPGAYQPSSVFGPQRRRLPIAASTGLGYRGAGATHPAASRPIEALFSGSFHVRAQPPALEHNNNTMAIVAFKKFEAWVTTDVQFWSCVAQNARAADEIFRARSKSFSASCSPNHSRQLAGKVEGLRCS